MSEKKILKGEIRYNVHLNDEQNSMIFGYIYKITNPKGRVYIGQSINIENRYNKYFNNNVKSQIKITRSISKYGFSSHVFEIIDYSLLGKKDLNTKETYWINYFNSMTKGLNCSLGGEGVGKGNIPWNKGKTNCFKQSNEAKEKIRLKMKGVKKSKETREKIRNSKLGSKNLMFGKEQSVITKFKKSLNNKRSRIVVNIETLEEYKCINDAAVKNNINPNTLRYQLVNNINKILKFK